MVSKGQKILICSTIIRQAFKKIQKILQCAKFGIDKTTSTMHLSKARWYIVEILRIFGSGRISQIFTKKVAKGGFSGIRTLQPKQSISSYEN